jgi:outer membrane protein assembly factor BamA
VAHYWLQERTGQQVDAKDANGNDVKATQATTQILEDCEAGRVAGCNGGFDNFFKQGITLDTRNFEPDPDYGVLAQLIGNFSGKFIGSEENYIRLNTILSGYYSLMPSITRLVAAARVLWSMSFGDVPFFTQPTYTFAGQDRFGLGGFFTFRGYQQGRFIGKVTALVNLELRWKFVEFQGWGQHFSVGITPFFETGRVYDEVSSAGLNDFFANWQWSTGAGLRLGWNLSTLIALDVGVSEEHQTFFMMMGHQF